VRAAKAAAVPAAALRALAAAAAAQAQAPAPAAALTFGTHSLKSSLSEVRSEKPAQMNLKKTNHKLLSDNHFDKGI